MLEEPPAAGDAAALAGEPQRRPERRLRARDDRNTVALFERLYDGLSEASDRVVEVIVSTLRTKLASAGIRELIETRRGFGYRVP